MLQPAKVTPHVRQIREYQRRASMSSKGGREKGKQKADIQCNRNPVMTGKKLQLPISHQEKCPSADPSFRCAKDGRDRHGRLRERIAAELLHEVYRLQ